MKPSRFSPRVLFAVALALLWNGASSVRADPPKVVDLRIQEVNQTTYFRIRLENPPDLAVETPRQRERFFRAEFSGADPMQWSQLVPQDDKARAVYLRPPPDEKLAAGLDRPVEKKVEIEEKKIPEEKKPEEKKAPDDPGKAGNDEFNGLEFLGKVTGKGEATFLLVYRREAVEQLPGTEKKGRAPLGGRLFRRQHRRSTEQKEEKKGLAPLEQLLQETRDWAEVPLKLDFSKAKTVAVPAGGWQRDPQRRLSPDDLQGRWAEAQAAYFGLLENATPEFGFYGFARETTARLYKVPVPPGGWGRFGGPDRGVGESSRRLYEVTTGAAAITESLALDRLRTPNFRPKDEQRTVSIAEVPGIDIAEHPWAKMMAGKKPTPEPMARLVPNDNYYVHFKGIAKFLEAGDLIDQWGTTLVRALEVHSKDHHLKQRLEQQLCLRSTALGRYFGPAVVKGIVVTGSDPYLREGTDLTLIFHLADKSLFRAGVEPFVQQARKKFGEKLHEYKSEHQQVAIESYVTPLREVCLHRAFFDDYAVYSNSQVAVRRVLDAHKGKIKALADSLDYQYMRTIFRLEDPEEDGFVFLSDPFIRNLVGPALRIKERRRLEALTSLQMVTHGALFTAWQTGKLPPNQQHLLAHTGLKAEELFTPDGNAAFWDGENRIAVSTLYHTLHFATPLIELPIDRVTPTEAREYEEFRQQYLGLWRRYFDPIGMRLSLKGDKVRWETYILPLIRNTQYNELRRITGDGSIKYDPAVFGDKTLLQFLIHLSPETLRGGLAGPGILDDLTLDLALRSWLGDWFTVRLDDSPVYAELLASYIRRETDPEGNHDITEDLERIFQVPLTLGVEIRNPMFFAGLLTGVRKMVENTLPGALEWGPMAPHKEVSIVRVKARPEGEVARMINNPASRRRLQPALYYALIDGAFYLSLQEAPLKDLIDRSAARKEGKGEKAAPQVEVNSSLYLSPRAAVQSRDLLRLYLEWEAHRRAQLNNRLLYALFRSHVVGPEDSKEAVDAAALHFLGFVPVSPDQAPFRYDPKKDEVSNLRHGSVRQPQLQLSKEASTPAERLLLGQLNSIRADLRFREDGIHTTLTFDKGSPKE